MALVQLLFLLVELAMARGASSGQRLLEEGRFAEEMSHLGNGQLSRSFGPASKPSCD